jgi:hypothetical protein
MPQTPKPETNEVQTAQAVDPAATVTATGIGIIALLGPLSTSPENDRKRKVRKITKKLA